MIESVLYLVEYALAAALGLEIANYSVGTCSWAVVVLLGLILVLWAKLLELWVWRR